MSAMIGAVIDHVPHDLADRVLAMLALKVLVLHHLSKISAQQKTAPTSTDALHVQGKFRKRDFPDLRAFDSAKPDHLRLNDVQQNVLRSERLRRIEPP